MLGLLYKEIILNKKYILSIAASNLMMSLTFFIMIIKGSDKIPKEFVIIFTSLIFLIMFMIMTMLAGNFFQTDESKKWAFFISSTPLTKKGQIKSKYLLTLILYAILYIWCSILSSLFDISGGGFKFYILCLMIVLAAIEYPFFVRFGSKIGANLKIAVVALICVLCIEYGLFGDMSIFENFGIKVFEFFSDADNVSDFKFILKIVSPCLAAVFYFLSYKISCRLYLKGAENYER